MNPLNLIDAFIKIKRLNYNFYKMNRNQLEKYQKKQLKKIINFVVQHSIYYNKIFRDRTPNYKNLPIMNKKIMMENFDIINTQGLKKYDIMNFMNEQIKSNKIDLYLGKYSCGLSSGTSGNKGLTVLSKKEMKNYSTVLWARKGLPLGVHGKRVLFALRRNNPSFMEVGKFGIKLVYVDYTVPVTDLIEKINSLKLSIIAGPPSLLIEIAKRCNEINIKIDALISYAEVLEPEIKHMIEQKFMAPVVQIYQGSEGFIASTCKDGKLHINEDLVYIELQNTDDEHTKKVIVTDLYRKTQPILKYELNDLIELDDKKCTCGSSFRVIKRIYGRMDDIFILDSDIGPKHLFPDYVRRSIIFASEEIKEYQAIQYDKHSIEIRLLIINENNRDKIEKVILENLRGYIDKIGAYYPSIYFSDNKPEVHPISKKLIRVWRKF